MSCLEVEREGDTFGVCVCVGGGLYHATYINHRQLHISTRQGVSAGLASFFLQQQRIFVLCKTALPAQDVVLPGAEQQGMKSDTLTGVAGVPLQTECGCKKGIQPSQPSLLYLSWHGRDSA